MNAMPRNEVLHDAVTTALSHALTAQDALLTLATELVERDDLSEGGPAGLAELAAARDAALRALGASVLGWVRLGGEIDLVEYGAETEAPSPDGPEEPVDGATAMANASDPGDVDASAPSEAAEEASPAPQNATPPPPATQAAVDALAERWTAGADTSTAAPPARPPRSPLGRLGPLPDLSDKTARKRELESLSTEGHRRPGWQALSADHQTALVQLIVARARDLQARFGGSLSERQRQRLHALFSELSRFQDSARPGFVHGLNRKHRPQRGSWREDAQHALEKLEAPPASTAEELLRAVCDAAASGDADAVVSATEAAVLGGVSSRDSRLLTRVAPFREDFARAGKCKTLRKALATQDQPADGSQPASTGADRLAHDILEHTQGKRALIIGGDRVGKNVERLQSAMGLNQLDWVSGRSVRRVGSIAERVRAGTYDLAIIVRGFVSHKVTDIVMPAIREAEGLMTVWCDRGCGMSAIERAIREAVEGPPHAR